MHRSEPVLAHMGVALGRGEIGVAEKLLNHTKVRPTVEEVGGEGVSEGVGMGRTGGSAIDDASDVAWSEGMQSPIHECGGRGVDKRGADNVDPRRQRRCCRLADRDDALFVSLAPDRHDLATPIPSAVGEPAQLGDPQPRAVEQLQNCLILAIPRIVATGPVEQIRDLALGQYPWEP